MRQSRVGMAVDIATRFSGREWTGVDHPSTGRAENLLGAEGLTPAIWP
jgi:hypothetical protein